MKEEKHFAFWFCISVLGFVLIIKTIKEEWHIAIRAYYFAVHEIFCSIITRAMQGFTYGGGGGGRGR